MQIVKFPEEQLCLINEIINKIVSCYSNLEMVEAIYMICFNSKKNNFNNLDLINESVVKPTININLVCDNHNLHNNFYDFYKELKKIRKLTGVDILITKSMRDDYGLCNRHREIVACKNLVNSFILYDKNSEYSKLKEKLESYNFFKYYEDLIVFEKLLPFSKKM